MGSECLTASVFPSGAMQRRGLREIQPVSPMYCISRPLSIRLNIRDVQDIDQPRGWPVEDERTRTSRRARASRLPSVFRTKLTGKAPLRGSEYPSGHTPACSRRLAVLSSLQWPTAARRMRRVRCRAESPHAKRYVLPYALSGAFSNPSSFCQPSLVIGVVQVSNLCEDRGSLVTRHWLFIHTVPRLVYWISRPRLMCLRLLQIDRFLSHMCPPLDAPSV